jgi:glycosyltransferase involved in cell wall biosynthesis
LRTEWGLENCFVVGYSGNFGRAHEAQTLLSVAEELKSRSDIRFLLIGEGSQHAMLRGEAEQRGLQNIMFRPYQPREMLGLSLTAIDLHLVSLRPELEGLIVPSKFYGIAAAARPMVYIGSENGEIAGKISRWQCGWVISPGNAPELAQLIVDLAENDSQCQETGLAARQAVNEQYSKTVSLAAWREQLEAVNTGIYPINR